MNAVLLVKLLRFMLIVPCENIAPPSRYSLLFSRKVELIIDVVQLFRRITAPPFPF